MNQQDSIEFKWLAEIQNRLLEVLLADGYSQKEAEEISFFVSQGIRDVPPLLHLLSDGEIHSSEEIMEAIYDVLVNRSALEEAYKLLSSKDNDIEQP